MTRLSLVGILGGVALAQLAGTGLLHAQPKAPKMTPPPVDAAEWKPLGTDGLMAWDVKEGTGEPIKLSATVTIHYTGWLTDGTVFDSSVKRGKMATFPLDNLIQGWQKGIPGMKPGGVRRLKIPYQLA